MNLIQAYKQMARGLCNYPDQIFYGYPEEKVEPPKPGRPRRSHELEKRVDPEFLKTFKSCPNDPDPIVVFYNFSQEVFLNEELTHKREQMLKHFLHYVHIHNFKSIVMDKKAQRVIGIIVRRNKPEVMLGVNLTVRAPASDVHAHTTSLQYYLGNTQVRSIKKSYANEQRIALNDIKIEKGVNDNELMLDNNWILYLDQYLFRDSYNEGIYSEITKLSMKHNLIHSIVPSTFRKFRKLTYLNLSANSIELLHDRTFSELVNLSYLDLSDNIIAFIELRAFEGLRQLKVLDLRSNRLNKLDFRKTPADQSSIFQNLSQLEQLDVSENFLRDFSANNLLFRDLTNLVDLNLSKNRIKIIHQEAFGPLRRLESLNLGFNNLNFIDFNHAETFSMLTNLKYLFLNNNRLLFLDEYYFYGLGKLTYLFLHSNKIAFISPDTFNRMAVENERGEPFSELRTLTLHDNPILERSHFKVRKLFNQHLFKKSTLSKYLILEKNYSQFSALMDDQKAVKHKRSIELALSRYSMHNIE